MREGFEADPTGIKASFPSAHRKESYLEAQWEIRKPVIAELYLHDGLSVEAVTSRLQQEGFYVTQRMLKTRLRKWKYYKKLRSEDMRAALQLLMDLNYDMGGPEPRLLIYGRSVNFTEIQRYFRRKGIIDPMRWLARLPKNNFKTTHNIELVGPQTSGDTPSPCRNEGSPSLSTSSISNTSSTPAEGLSHGPRCTLDSNFDDQVAQDHDTRADLAEGTFNTTINLLVDLHFPLHVSYSRIIDLTNNYCASYTVSGRSLHHFEPTVHHLTLHAMFAHHIQDGVALLLQRDTRTAFEKFETGFALVRKMVANNHPMAITLLMSIVCDLDSRQLQLDGLTNALIRHVKNLASVECGEFDPLTQLFRAFSEAEGEAMHLALLIARKTVECVESTNADNNLPDWKALYVRERLLDCLYYARCDYERAAGRRALLLDQQTKYGTGARNVLWTLMNIADDDLLAGRMSEAENAYEKALEMADLSSGYGRAKTRTAALEGLARCNLEVTLANLERTSDRDAFRKEKLTKAIYLLREAEAEACVWFEPSNRRLARFREEIGTIEIMLCP